MQEMGCVKDMAGKGNKIDHRSSGVRPGPKVIKLFSCSAQLTLKFILLMPSVGTLTFISRINYRL